MQILSKILNFKLPQIVLFIFSLWLLSLLFLSQVYLCFSVIDGCLDFRYFKMLAQWDGQNFLNIAHEGYTLLPLYAFFPLFPLVIKFMSHLLPFAYLMNGLFLNWVLMGIGIYFLVKLLQMDYKRKEIIGIILMILAFPFSFFFVALYSEALFFCLSILAFYCYKSKKNGWAVFFLFFLVLTRMAGVALVAAFIIDSMRKKENVFLYFIPLLGLAGYVLFTFYHTGNILALVIAEENWQRMVVYPGFSILNSLNVLLTQGFSFGEYGIVVDLLLVLAVVILILRSYRFLPRLYWFYALLSVLIPLSTSTFLSFPRFLIVLFPLFIAFYQMSNTMVRVVYLIVGFILQQFLFWSFLQGGWVA